MRIEDSTDPTPSTSGNYAEYEAKSIPNPLFGYVEKVLSPWVKKRYKLSIDGLHEEILDVYHWLRPSKVETALRYSVFERVKSVIHDKWKDFDIKVSVFGSLRTNLFLPTSDIDVLVECSAWQDISSILKETADALKASGMAETISVYSEAFVPIVKMIDNDTLVSIDISFNTVQGVRAADYIEKVKEEFPVVEPLILILKQFLIQRNLNQTFTGGLSSYGLILMLISFLQIYAMPVRRKSFYDFDVNLGELLMRFFEVYAQEFNYLEVGISVEDCRYRKKNNSLDFKSPVLSLEDPLLRSNEVGRSTFNFAAVQTSFSQALQVLKGVFVRDRRRNTDFNEILYKSGSMLALIMPFTPQQVEYRCWLKSQSLSQRHESQTRKIERADKMRTPLLVTNTCISPYINLDTVSWNQHHTSVKTPKPLSILPPSSDKKPTESEETGLLIDEKTMKNSKENGVSSENAVPKKEELAANEKENNEKHIKKPVSPRKDDPTKKDGKGKKVTDSYSYSSAVHKNSKKQGDARNDKNASNHNNSAISTKKSESDTVNGTKRHSGLETKKSERRPDITYYNPAARSHRNHPSKKMDPHNDSSDSILGTPPANSSQTEIKVEKVNHSWTVKNFSHCYQEYLENFVYLTRGDEQLTWSIKIYPKGNGENNKDFVFLCLNRVVGNGKSSKIGFKSRFMLRTAELKEIEMRIHPNPSHSDYVSYIKRDVLFPQILPRDLIIVNVEIDVAVDTVTTCAEPTLASANCEQQLVADYQKMFRDDVLTDFTIRIGADGREIRCHKAILAARSPVFGAMLLHEDTAEAKTGILEIWDLEYDVVHEMIYYIYCGRCQKDIAEIASDLLIAADKYSLTELKNHCEKFLVENITPDTACQLLVLGDMYNAAKLRKSAVQLILARPKVITGTSGWDDILKQHPALVTDIVNNFDKAQSGFSAANLNLSGSSQ